MHTHIRRHKKGKAEEVVNMQDIARHLRINEDEIDEYVKSLVTAAVESIQATTWRTLIPHSYELYYDDFVTSILPYAPIDTQSVKVFFIDTQGVEQELDDSSFEVTPDDNQPRIVYNESVVNAIGLHEEFDSVGTRVRVEYDAGYDKLPAALQSAISLLTGHLYDNPEAVTAFTMQELPMGVRYLISHYRLNQY